MPLLLHFVTPVTVPLLAILVIKKQFDDQKKKKKENSSTQQDIKILSDLIRASCVIMGLIVLCMIVFPETSYSNTDWVSQVMVQCISLGLTLYLHFIVQEETVTQKQPIQTAGGAS